MPNNPMSNNPINNDTPRGGRSRRAFLKRLAAAGGALLIGGDALASVPAAQPKGTGVQLYTLRDRMKKDFEGTLEKVAALGYKKVEFAGYYDRTPKQVRSLLDRLGLSSPSAHIGLDLLREDLKGQIASAKTIGQRYLTVPALMEAFQGKITPDEWKGYAAEFNEIGEALKKADLQLAYHNHAFEFVPADGDRTGYDVLVQETDPALVSFELDLMWVVVGGQQPADLIEKYPGRFPLWHVKDIRDIAGARKANSQGIRGMRDVLSRVAAVGEGEINFERIFKLKKKAGLEHFFVENDNPKDSLANIEVSIQNLERILS